MFKGEGLFGRHVMKEIKDHRGQKSELQYSPSWEIWEGKSLPFKIISCAEARLWGIDPWIVLGQHATVAWPALHIDLLLTHHTQLSLSNTEKVERRNEHGGRKISVHTLSECTVFTVTTDRRAALEVGNKSVIFNIPGYLVVQVPRLIISIHASPAKEALVVDLDQLPLWPMAEVSKETGGWFTKDYLEIQIQACHKCWQTR